MMDRYIMDREEGVLGVTSHVNEKLEPKTVEFIKLGSTIERPNAQGIYIVRFSPKKRDELGVRDGDYVRITYGNVSVLGCLRVDENIDNELIRMDQTLRTAIALDRIMQGSGGREGCQKDSRILEKPIKVQDSRFPGPNWLARLIKQQYLVCMVHHASPEDMEASLVRLPQASMEVLGIDAGDKVLLESEGSSFRMRCLVLKSEIHLPLKTMSEDFTPLWTQADDAMHLPWITMDLHTRQQLDVQPWEPILVGRDPLHALVSEFDEVMLAIALAAVLGTIGLPEYQLLIMLVGFSGILILILLKLRSRI